MSEAKMPSCVALGCSNTGDTEGITFHKFPGHPLGQLRWVSAGRMRVWDLSRESTLCSAHFRPEDIDRTSPNGPQIREGAIPCFFPELKQDETSEQVTSLQRLRDYQMVMANTLSSKNVSKSYPVQDNRQQMVVTQVEQFPSKTIKDPCFNPPPEGPSSLPPPELEDQEVKPTVCPKCGLVFEKTDNIQEHRCIDPEFENKVKAVLAFTYPRWMKEIGEKPISELINQPPKLSDFKFICSVCGLSFNVKKELISHEKSHEEPKVYKCDICQKTYNLRQSYRQHMLTHSEAGSVKQFVCEQCGKEFKSKQSMVLHLSNHLGIMYKCTECEKSFTTKRSLNTHMLGHSGERPFCCEICGKTYSQKASLRVHMRSHEPNRNFKCTMCEKSFYMSGSLTDHMRTHTNERPFICDKCGKGFAQKTQLTAHQWTHMDVKPLKCSVCEMTFAQRRNLIDHELIHFDLKPFTCEDCGKSYRRKTHLKNHKCKKKRMSLECEVCNVVFPRRRNLEDHQLIHFGLKPFTCEYCGKSFRRKGRLKEHKCKARPLAELGMTSTSPTNSDKSDKYVVDESNVIEVLVPQPEGS